MDDLISRQALLAEYDRLHVGEPGRARKMIEDAPSVQPEIIRCKDCKWSDWYDVDGYKYCYCIETVVSGRTADDFCSYAERETDGC